MDGFSKKQFINQKLKEIASLYHQAASYYGLTDGEFWVLYTIFVIGGDYSQQDISDLLFLPKQTINSVISKLRKKGYVYLEPVPNAGNKKLIKLTKSGKKLGEETVLLIYKAEQRALLQFSEEELDTISRLSDKYVTILRKELLVEEE
ncbi:MAG: MarR family transcriptional regulator [Bacilli bacterium]|nr:MarR family transcriptional regulator [Bacilli bacterium]